MKFGQLIECNMRNMFLEKSYTKYCEETSPRRFSEKLKLNLSLDKQSKVLYSLFLLYGKFRAFKIYCNSAADHLLSPYIKLFQKNKQIWNQSPCFIFCIIFEEKYSSCHIPLIDRISLFGYLYFGRYLGICVMQLLVNQVVTS